MRKKSCTIWRVNSVQINSRPASLLFSLLFLPTAPAADQINTSITTSASKDARFTEFFRRSSGWIAGDGALSVPLSDGRVLWLFGDSHVDDLDPVTGTMPCLFQTRNAAFIHKTTTCRIFELLSDQGQAFAPGSRIRQMRASGFGPDAVFKKTGMSMSI